METVRGNDVSEKCTRRTPQKSTIIYLRDVCQTFWSNCAESDSEGGGRGGGFFVETDLSETVYYRQSRFGFTEESRGKKISESYSPVLAAINPIMLLC